MSNPRPKRLNSGSFKFVIPRCCLLTALVIVVAGSISQDAVAQATYDPDPCWPLAGRISEDPPAGWNAGDNCPADRFGNANYNDLPLSSPFGPRQKASESYRYDFHRGIDIPTPIGTPIFAITNGKVKIAGNHSAYTDPVIQIEHKDSSYRRYYTQYLHLGQDTAQNYVIAVSAGQTVSKGQYIGQTGATGGTGYAHLHFEVRTPPTWDKYSRWQRDSINPLAVLAYDDSSTPTVDSTLDNSDPNNPIINTTVTTDRVDINRVEVILYDADGEQIVQPGNTATGALPDRYGNPRGYFVKPAHFDMQDWCFQWSHKNSSKYPWSKFSEGGTYACPYDDPPHDHGATYNANVHLDAQSPSDASVGQFNGVTIAPARYDAGTNNTYVLELTFNELVGPLSSYEVVVFDAAGMEIVREAQ